MNLTLCCLCMCLSLPVSSSLSLFLSLRLSPSSPSSPFLSASIHFSRFFSRITLKYPPPIVSPSFVYAPSYYVRSAGHCVSTRRSRRRVQPRPAAAQLSDRLRARVPLHRVSGGRGVVGGGDATKVHASGVTAPPRGVCSDSGGGTDIPEAAASLCVVLGKARGESRHRGRGGRNGSYGRNGRTWGRRKDVCDGSDDESWRFVGLYDGSQRR